MNQRHALFGNKGKRKTTPDGISKPFATRLWNEPLVIFRDETGELNCMSDVCPHGSAPLSSVWGPSKMTF